MWDAISSKYRGRADFKRVDVNDQGDSDAQKYGTPNRIPQLYWIDQGDGSVVQKTGAPMQTTAFENAVKRFGL